MVAKPRHNHPVEWVAPAPTWSQALSQQRLNQPLLLRFATDSFMDELAAVLASNSPAHLTTLEARPETWEQAPGTLPASTPLKLYHPAHGRFYLIAASLICRIPGMPDRTIDPAAQEKAAFVLRRRPAPGVEQAWVVEERKGRWQTLTNAKSLPKLEERLPMFPMHYVDGARTRRVLAGFIPTASKETYDAAHEVPSPFEPDPDVPDDPRTLLYDARIERTIGVLVTKPAALNDDERKEVTAALLLDLADFLKTYIPAVWSLIEADPTVDRDQPALYKALGHKLQGQTAWRQALKDVYTNWRTATGFDYSLSTATQLVPGLRATVIAAYPSEAPPSLPPPSLPKIDPDEGHEYVIRCVYERPCCKELHPAVVSDPSAPFLIASFFDPDAPARDVRIVMPRDTSIKGLRRMRKSVSIIVSEKLRSQMERFRGIEKITGIDSPPAKQNFSFGMVCTLSIPIITICALILLMIILQLLNIVFWWLPFVKICLPIKRR